MWDTQTPTALVETRRPRLKPLGLRADRVARVTRPQVKAGWLSQVLNLPVPQFPPL